LRLPHRLSHCVSPGLAQRTVDSRPARVPRRRHVTRPGERPGLVDCNTQRRSMRPMASWSSAMRAYSSLGRLHAEKAQPWNRYRRPFKWAGSGRCSPLPRPIERGSSPTFSPTFYCDAGNARICCVGSQPPQLPRRLFEFPLASASSTYVQYACGSLGRKPCISRHFRRLATNAGEKVGLNAAILSRRLRGLRHQLG
jgi:hypothetical protein